MSLIFSRIVGEATLPNNILNIVIIVLFCLLYLFSTGQVIEKNKMQGHDFVDLITSMSISLLVFLFIGTDFLFIISCMLFIFSVFGKIQPKIFFLLSGICFFGVILFKLLLSNQYADYLSLQALFLLLFGISSILIDDKLLRYFHTVIMPIDKPIWWNNYIEELKKFATYLSLISPYIFAVSVFISFGPISNLFKFDERFITNITFVMCALLPLNHSDTKIGNMILFLILCSTYLFMFQTYIEGMTGLLFFTLVSWIYFIRNDIYQRLVHIFQPILANVTTK